MALAEDDDLLVGQRHQLHRHLSAAQHCRPQTGQTLHRLPVYHFIYLLRIRGVQLMFVFLQGGTLNKTTKRSEQAARDSDREPLTQGEDQQNEDEEENAVRSRSINS